MYYIIYIYISKKHRFQIASHQCHRVGSLIGSHYFCGVYVLGLELFSSFSRKTSAAHRSRVIGLPSPSISHMIRVGSPYSPGPTCAARGCSLFLPSLNGLQLWWFCLSLSPLDVKKTMGILRFKRGFFGVVPLRTMEKLKVSSG